MIKMIKKKFGANFIRNVAGYLLLGILIAWVITEPRIVLSVRDAINVLLILMFIYLIFENNLIKSSLTSKYRNQKRMLESICKNCPDIIVYKDYNLKYLVYNEPFVKYLGLDCKQDYTDKTILETAPMEVAQTIDKKDREVLMTLKPARYKLELKGGITLEMVSTPIFSDNLPVGIITIGRDVTKEIKIKAQKESFVATLTHDLKTPTIAQIRALEMMLDGSFGKIEGVQREMVEQILKSCKFMLGMITFVLSTYKFENGQAKLQSQEFNLKDLIEETAEELKSIADEKKIKFSLDLNVKNSAVTADRTQLKRVIINMVSNAVSYAYDNTVIEIGLKEDKNSISFYTTNSSPYIPSDILNHVFDKYVSGPASAKFSKVGTGLGLYLSEKIIEAHKGKIIAKSEKDNKNTFGFKIPKNFSGKLAVTF